MPVPYSKEAPTLRIGLAGVGSVSRTVLPAVEKAPNVRLAAVADTRREPLDRCREKYGCETYTSVEAMCADPNLDAVWICTPNMFHAEHAIVAAEHGKHVICEKPMAISIEQAQAMAEAVEKTAFAMYRATPRSSTRPFGGCARSLPAANWAA